MYKILIIGSNFGSKTYLKSFLKLKKKFQIFICSPNILKKKIDKNIIKGDVELAMTFFNIIFNSNIDIIYLIDKYFGSMPAVFTLAVTQRLFNTSVVYDDIEYRNIRKRLRDISIRLDRLEIIK